MTQHGIDPQALAEEAREYLQRQHPNLRVGIISAQETHRRGVIILHVEPRDRALMEAGDGGK